MQLCGPRTKKRLPRRAEASSASSHSPRPKNEAEHAARVTQSQRPASSAPLQYNSARDHSASSLPDDLEPYRGPCSIKAGSHPCAMHQESCLPVSLRDALPANTTPACLKEAKAKGGPAVQSNHAKVRGCRCDWQTRDFADC